MNPLRSLKCQYGAARRRLPISHRTPILTAVLLGIMAAATVAPRTSAAAGTSPFDCASAGCPAQSQGEYFINYVSMAVATEDPTLCGSSYILRVPVGTPMNYCYVAVNQSSYTLAPNTLVDSVDGVLIAADDGLALAPFSTFQFNRIVIASETADYDSLWTASGFFGIDATSDAHMRLLVSGTPTVAATPAAISEHVATGGTAVQILQIGNKGDQILRWEINQTAAAPGGPLPGSTVPVPAVGVCAFDCTSWTSVNLTDPEKLYDLINPKLGNYQAQTFVDDDFDKVYVVTSAGGGGGFAIPPNMLATVDAREGVFDQDGYTVIGPVTGAIGGGDTWDGMKWDATTGNVYLLSHNLLFTIDLATAVATPIGPIDGPGISADAEIIDIAVAPGGKMVGLDWINDVLLEIDKTTGNARVIGPLGVDAGIVKGGMDFDASTGVLYWAAYTVDSGGHFHSDVDTINTTTGAATPYATLTASNTNALSSLSIAVPRTTCPPPGDAPWLTVTDGAGVISVDDKPRPVTLTFNATGLAPGTYTTSLCVRSNDPNHRTLAVPVEMVVGADVVFADGFES